MLKLEEQLKQFPEEFTLIMEEIKDKNFEPSLTYILEKFNVSKQLEELDEETKNDFILFLKQLYIFGFYSGVSFSINPYDYVKDIYKENVEA